MRKALHILGILDDLDIAWMAERGVLHHLSSGTTLIEEHKTIESICILLEGQLSVMVGGANGTHIASLLPGEIVGEISFVDSRPPVASVIAVQDSQVLMLPRSVLSAKLAKDLAFSARFYRAIASFLADRLYVTVGRFGYGSAHQDIDVDEVDETSMEEISLAAVRFDRLLKQLRGDHTARTISAS